MASCPIHPSARLASELTQRGPESLPGSNTLAYSLRASVHSSVHSCLCGFFFLHKAIKLLSEMHDVFQIPEMRPRLLLALDLSVEMVIVLVIRTVWPLLAILLLDTLAW
jgi:hypothetical protein